MGRAESAAAEGRVKLHVFSPSGRELWTVVGRGGEHWVDPEAGYCSGPAAYFGRGRGGGRCYHLESALLARRGGGARRSDFDDSEYARFVAGIAASL